MSKTRQTEKSGWQKFANFFGVLGYITIIMEWSWISALYLPLLIENDSVRSFLLPSKDATQPAVTATQNEPSLLLMILALIITAFVIIGSAILLIRLPMKVAKTSHKAAEKTAIAAIPVLVHHKKVTKKKKKLLTARIIAWLKLIAIILPLVALAGMLVIKLQIAHDLFILVTVSFALVALISFMAQYSIALWKKIPSDKVL